MEGPVRGGGSESCSAANGLTLRVCVKTKQQGECNGQGVILSKVPALIIGVFLGGGGGGRSMSLLCSKRGRTLHKHIL